MCDKFSMIRKDIDYDDVTNTRSGEHFFFVCPSDAAIFRRYTINIAIDRLREIPVQSIPVQSIPNSVVDPRSFTFCSSNS